MIYSKIYFSSSLKVQKKITSFAKFNSCQFKIDVQLYIEHDLYNFLKSRNLYGDLFKAKNGITILAGHSNFCKPGFECYNISNLLILDDRFCGKIVDLSENFENIKGFIDRKDEIDSAFENLKNTFIKTLKQNLLEDI